jgi:putative endonuclease
MHYLYIIRSRQSGKYYTGETNDVAQRLKQHQAGRTSFGSRNKDIGLIYKKELQNRSVAKKLEYFIKRQKSSLFIERFIKGEIIPP